MYSVRDITVSDSLQDFEAALSASRDQLQREQDRLAECQKNLKIAKAQVDKLESERREVSETVETLDNECSRISHINNRRREQLFSQKDEMTRLRRPRQELEEEAAKLSMKSEEARKRFCHEVTRQSQAILEFLSVRDPDALRQELARKEREVAAATARVEKFRRDLRLSAALAAASPITNTHDTRPKGVRADVCTPLKSESTVEELQSQLEAAKTKHEKFMSNIKEERQQLIRHRDVLRANLRSFAQTIAHADRSQQTAHRQYCDLLDQTSSLACVRCGGRLSGDVEEALMGI
eukprot:Tbor_TRINITY_DN6575_c0_g1::TRINITY_DN6575_c0_g1_i1::g.7447::m.7447